MKTLYSDICSCVINNGHASEFFKLERGVRQGCPLSPLLFILSVELLAIAVRKTETIEGIQVKDTVFKMSQFADDTTFFVANEKSAKAVLKLLQDFTYCSGLKVNLDKTEARWIGSKIKTQYGNLQVKWTQGPFKALGIWFDEDAEVMQELNIENKLGDISKLLRLWSWRDLSLIGKNMVVKSLAISKILYQCSCIPVAEDTKKKIQEIINEFIWDKKNT